MTEIRVSVRDEPTSEFRLAQRISLTYELRNSVLHEPLLAGDAAIPQCLQNALRYLTEIQVTAFNPEGNDVAAPRIKFHYNSRRNVTVAPQSCSPVGACIQDRKIATPAPGHYGDLDGAIGTRIDLDSDGLPDLISVVEENGFCVLVWQKGRAGGSFDVAERKSRLPTAPWHNPRLGAERCTLNGQTAARDRSVMGNEQAELGVLSYHFLDYTGDGRIDLLTNVWAGFAHESYEPMPLEGPVPVAAPSGPPILSNNPHAPLQPERAGPEFIWRVYRNAGDVENLTPTDTEAFSTLPMTVKSPKPLPPAVSDEHFDKSVVPSSILPVLFDLDGDGFKDVIDIVSHPNFIGQKKTGCDGLEDPLPSWCVHYGNGGPRFAVGREWIVPAIKLSTDNGGEPVELSDRVHKRQRTVAVLEDINGDGLPDLVVRMANGALKAHLSDGSRFENESSDLGKNFPIEDIQTKYSLECTPVAVCEGDRGYRQRLIDVDSDGLPDILSFLGSETDIAITEAVSASFNLGDRFARAVPLAGTRWARAKRLFKASEREWSVLSDFVDIDGDGLEDLVKWSENADELEYFENPGLPDAPDLLTRVENGRGAFVQFSYAPSTESEVVAFRARSSLPPDAIVDGAAGYEQRRIRNAEPSQAI